MPRVIHVGQLRKSFQVPLARPGQGLFHRLRRFLHPPTTELLAVRDLSFDVEEGEILGFLGANGSGKSTTIKMLTGILTPSGGEIDVLGYVPHRQRLLYTAQIGVVLAQKSLLWWNIPVIESFKLYRDIYGQSRLDFERRLAQFSEVLEITDFLHVPVRKLSLGLRMRAEIVASLLHQPKIIFLDEPTIGLDVRARLNLKRFLKRINEEMGITLFLTTHNMLDVEDLCPRVILMAKGEKVYDGNVQTLRESEETKTIEAEFVRVVDPALMSRVLDRGRVLESTATTLRLLVPSASAVEFIDDLFTACQLTNLNVLPPSLESIVERLLREPAGSAIPWKDSHRGKEPSVAA